MYEFHRTRQRTISLIVYQLQPSATIEQCCDGYQRSQESGNCERMTVLIANIKIIFLHATSE